MTIDKTNTGRKVGRWKETGDPARKITMYDKAKRIEREAMKRKENRVPDVLSGRAKET